MRIRKAEAVRIEVCFRNRVLEGDPFVMEVDDNARVKILLEDPDTGSWTTIFLEATWCGPHIGLHPEKNGSQSGGYIRIVGDEGVIETASAEQITVRHWSGGRTELPLKAYPGESISFNHEIETFVDAVRSGTAPQFDTRFGAEVIATMGAAYLSAIRETAVTLEEFKRFSRGYVEKHGDTERAEEAILTDLLAPYRLEKRA